MKARSVPRQLCSITAFIVACWVTPASGTILTFDQIRLGGVIVPTISGNAPPQDYGDRVAGSPQAAPGGFFTYGEAGEGFTPNVVVEYSVASVPSGGVSLWQSDYGDLTNVLFGNQNSQILRVSLSADPSFEVLLYGFDLGGWPNTNYTINAVRVLNGGGALFSQSDVPVFGALSGPRRTTFDFGVPLQAGELLIEIDYSNLPGNQQDNIGIDNIRFGQDPAPAAIPEPSVALLLGFGSLCLIIVRRVRAIS